MECKAAVIPRVELEQFLRSICWYEGCVLPVLWKTRDFTKSNIVVPNQRFDTRVTIDVARQLW